MEMIENGMVVGAAHDWEQMYADTPADNATTDDFDMFAWQTGLVAEVLANAYGFRAEDISESVAQDIYCGLPAEYAAGLIRDWSQKEDVKERYNHYIKEGY
jgi:hypothetical protein